MLAPMDGVFGRAKISMEDDGEWTENCVRINAQIGIKIQSQLPTEEIQQYKTYPLGVQHISVHLLPLIPSHQSVPQRQTASADKSGVSRVAETYDNSLGLGDRVGRLHLDGELAPLEGLDGQFHCSASN